MTTIKNYEFLKIIGEGATSTVYKALDTSTNEYVALKLIRKTQKNMKLAKNEINILQSLDHENIIKMKDCFENEKYIFIVLELCNPITMNSLSGLSERNIKKIIRSILLGVRYFHSKNILHRDLKISNILVDGEVIKICDFGLSCYFDGFLDPNTFCGTMDYLSPEMKNRDKYKEGIDVWAVGVILYILITKKKFYSFNEDLECSEDLKDLLYKMLNKEQTQRISIEETLRHSCFNELFPVFYNFYSLKDFLKEFKYFTFIKESNVLKIKCDVEILIENMLKDNSNDSEIEILDIYKNNLLIYIENMRFNMFHISNTYLKIISFLFNYIKILRDKTPKIILKDESAELYFMLSKKFIYINSKFIIKMKDDNYQIKIKENTKIINTYYTKELDENKTCIEHLLKKCKEIEKTIDWRKQPLPLYADTNSLYRKPVSNFICPSSIYDPTTCSNFVQSVIFNNITDFKYFFERDIGWCIKRNTEFTFLFIDGVKMEINELKSIFYEEEGKIEKYVFEKNIPKHIKTRLKTCLLFFKYI